MRTLYRMLCKVSYVILMVIMGYTTLQPETTMDPRCRVDCLIAIQTFVRNWMTIKTVDGYSTKHAKGHE